MISKMGMILQVTLLCNKWIFFFDINYSYIVCVLLWDEKFKMVLYFKSNNYFYKLDILILIYSGRCDINLMY